MAGKSRHKNEKQDKALIVLRNICRCFNSGDAPVTVLKNINLTIARGEMVAIVGSSGSGKSTLMNILGCLDQPSSGSYHIDGREVSTLDANALSALRRHHFGFIFQRYHLMGALTALGNVEIPAIYAGVRPEERKKRAVMLLARLGMGSRTHHRPGQLSGGQQQRVSIARALMNDGEIILADEPTGALDKHSGEEVLTILEEIHASGRTIILVTHDMAVAKRAERIIEISDGEILSDRPNKRKTAFNPKIETIKTEKAIAPLLADAENEPAEHRTQRQKLMSAASSFWDRFFEAQLMALLSMKAHRMRTFLTMLGVIIGIAAVIDVVALGKGTQKQILASINRLGTNALTIFAGKSMADVRAAKVTTLVEADAKALAELPFVDAVTPMVSTSTIVRRGNVDANATLSGVSEQYFAADGARLEAGRLFDADDVKARRLSLIIEAEAAQTLFPNGEDPVGKIVLVGNVAARIAGTVNVRKYGPNGGVIALYLPYTTVQTRFLGNTILRSITVLLSQNVDSRWAQAQVARFLEQRHNGTQDFFIRNSQDFMDEVMSTTNVLTMLVISIAFVSLFVGGIGVMNIMLVTVSERINEIGVRMAVGARREDILQQFLIEAVLVCLTGGLIGIAFGFFTGFIFDATDAPFKMIYSLSSIITAFIVSTLIGIAFGYLPARNASRLNPVAALSQD
ncbi:MAG: MacB family efflux pump subunit [Candidatus Tokpelaia sp.]|uniref:MacB family efflux pump subunit n=1 Tax=Candidatus Tokpelaia sp. TaxID=2233777 RepID=UPI0012386C73|nr:MacB family efflux pump subunit [Candidatus Tokpelaia sp.]KAA6205609.1 MAG: MacB family efflux pump subunit [Candidatus Tokpelaia sp.]KAA6206283.1 MAG: MacB family efflux pump subunit [Candidatus Tokpelaia sp.]KAA6406282.1 macrolide ABC transporter permease/ATP-binding protein MacB [Candidatus Tokpelaia sp.]